MRILEGRLKNIFSKKSQSKVVLLKLDARNLTRIIFFYFFPHSFAASFSKLKKTNESNTKFIYYIQEVPLKKFEKLAKI